MDLSSVGDAPISQDERLIQAVRLVRSVIDELAEEVCGDDVTPQLRGHPTPFGQFDAGHLCAAETLMIGHLSEDASARYAKEDEHRRWQNVVKTIVSHQASSELAEPAPRLSAKRLSEWMNEAWHPTCKWVRDGGVSPQADDREIGWLLEAVPPSRAYWAPDIPCGYTMDSTRSPRFARYEDAERVLRSLPVSVQWRPVEHVWVRAGGVSDRTKS